MLVPSIVGVFFFFSQVKTQYAWSHHFFSLWELAVARRFVPMFDSSAGPLGSEKIWAEQIKRSCWMFVGLGVTMNDNTLQYIIYIYSNIIWYIIYDLWYMCMIYDDMWYIVNKVSSMPYALFGVLSRSTFVTSIDWITRTLSTGPAQDPLRRGLEGGSWAWRCHQATWHERYWKIAGWWSHIWPMVPQFLQSYSLWTLPIFWATHLQLAGSIFGWW